MAKGGMDREVEALNQLADDSISRWVSWAQFGLSYPCMCANAQVKLHQQRGKRVPCRRFRADERLSRFNLDQGLTRGPCRLRPCSSRWSARSMLQHPLPERDILSHPGSASPAIHTVFIGVHPPGNRCYRAPPRDQSFEATRRASNRELTGVSLQATPVSTRNRLRSKEACPVFNQPPFYLREVLCNNHSPAHSHP